MAIVLVVKWVNQVDHPDACRRIQHVGGMSGAVTWRHTHDMAVQFIEKEMFTYYLKTGQNTLKLEVGVTPDGCKYLKTKADNGTPKILLNQPGFPGLPQAG